jgi:phosphoglycerate kinase
MERSDSARLIRRPKVSVDKYSLAPVRTLRELFQGLRPVSCESIGVEITTSSIEFAYASVMSQKTTEQMKDGDVLLLENLRFHAEEEKNDDGFARQLASLCDTYVNDAFGAAHRAHASTAGITKFVQPAAAGLLMEKELDYLGRVIDNPEHPFIAILGGAKVSDKIPVINALIDRKVDRLLIGGAMAYMFLKAEGFTVGKSLVENEMLDTARQIKSKCEQSKVELLLPTDHQVVDSYEPIKAGKVAAKTIPVEFTNAGHAGMDIGVETVNHFAQP